MKKNVKIAIGASMFVAGATLVIKAVNNTRKEIDALSKRIAEETERAMNIVNNIGVTDDPNDIEEIIAQMKAAEKEVAQNV